MSQDISVDIPSPPDSAGKASDGASGASAAQETRELERSKTTLKTTFTNVRRNLLVETASEKLSKTEIQSWSNELDVSYADVRKCMESLVDSHQRLGDRSSADKVLKELQTIAEQYEKAVSSAADALQTITSILSSTRASRLTSRMASPPGMDVEKLRSALERLASGDEFGAHMESPDVRSDLAATEHHAQSLSDSAQSVQRAFQPLSVSRVHTSTQQPVAAKPLSSSSPVAMATASPAAATTVSVATAVLLPDLSLSLPVSSPTATGNQPLSSASSVAMATPTFNAVPAANLVVQPVSQVSSSGFVHSVSVSTPTVPLNQSSSVFSSVAMATPSLVSPATQAAASTVSVPRSHGSVSVSSSLSSFQPIGGSSHGPVSMATKVVTAKPGNYGPQSNQSSVQFSSGSVSYLNPLSQPFQPQHAVHAVNSAPGSVQQTYSTNTMYQQPQLQSLTQSSFSQPVALSQPTVPVQPPSSVQTVPSVVVGTPGFANSSDMVSQHSGSYPSTFNQQVPFTNWYTPTAAPVVEQPLPASSLSAPEASNAGFSDGPYRNGPWQQLKKVSLPTFKGEVRKYESWRAAFRACIDESPLPAHHKLLYLREYLGGEALQAIDSLPYTPTAYQAALDRLERKYGGERRRIALYVENLHALKQVRHGKAKDMERFVEVLDILVVNLKDSGRESELGMGTFYMNVLKKLDERTLADFKRWVASRAEVESVEVLLKWASQESQFLTEASETLTGLENESNQSASSKDTNPVKVAKPKMRSFVTVADAQSSVSCPVCGGSHRVASCQKFRDEMNVSQRWKEAKIAKLCYRCLATGHLGNNCPRNRPCGENGCRESHHRLLHHFEREDAISVPLKKKEDGNAVVSESKIGSKSTAAKESTGKTTGSRQSEQDGKSFVTWQRTESTTSSAQPAPSSSVSLRTIPVVLKYGQQTVTVNALLDDASTHTYLSTRVASELGLPGKAVKATVQVLNGEESCLDTKFVQLELASVDGCARYGIEACTLDSVTGNLEATNWAVECKEWPHLRNVPFPKMGSQREVDLLIGGDHVDLHRCLEEIPGNPGEPVARRTVLGWTCIGQACKTGIPRPPQSAYFGRTFYVGTDTNLVALDKTLRHFWEVEASGTQPDLLDVASMSEDDRIATECAQQSLVSQNGRYQVALPWNDLASQLKNNKAAAELRLKHTERRLRRDNDVASSYGATIQKYLEKGYIELVDEDKDDEGVWYLPHFPVLRPDKATTKVRIVFDAAARCGGLALNDSLRAGPKLQRDLFEVLIRFRNERIAVCCDIQEMYLQIAVEPRDCRRLRFLWRGLEEQQPLQTYQFKRLAFGLNVSPFLAQFVIQEHARRHFASHPRGAEAILQSTYMDDTMDSVPDVDSAVALYEQLCSLWSSAGMKARKWLSNSSEVLANIPQQDRASEIDISCEDLPSIKTLGVMWSADADQFTFKFHPVSDNVKMTKREYLRRLATVFDPLGLVAPFVVQGKLIMQDLWTSGVDWDDTVPPSIESAIRRWYAELCKLPQVSVPRCIRSGPNPSAKVTFHVFVDASCQAYGAVIYARTSLDEGLGQCQLVASKSRVAPLKALSIPRMELMAAVLGVQLLQSVAGAIGENVQQAVYWSDSMDVLYWIHSPSRNFKPFVSHRVGEIQSIARPDQWFYVPTKSNPADVVSRGASVANLVDNALWWEGPGFLQRSPADWPETPVAHHKLHPDAQSEEKRTTLVSVQQEPEDYRLDPKRFSSWTRLRRITALVLRFVNNLREPTRKTGSLSVSELEDADQLIISTAQRQEFAEEYQAIQKGKPVSAKSPLVSLNPRLDSDGLLRCDGRMKFADWISYDSRYPVILPRHGAVSQLIIKYYHEKQEHGGTNQTLAAMSSKYWLVSGREAIRQWERVCSTCKLRKAQPAEQQMAPLPKARSKLPLRAFSRVAVDYGGPYITIQGRGRRREKRYLCLFTCLLSRAVHLEVAYGLDTDSFLRAFARFAYRRGLPIEIISDNGTNFVGAARELQVLVEAVDEEAVSRTLANKGVTWTFNPPWLRILEVSMRL